MFTMAPPPACSRMTAPAAYEHATVPLRSTASRRSSLRSHSQLGRLAGEHVRAGVVDPHVESAEPFTGLRHQRLACVAGAQVRLGDQARPPAPAIRSATADAPSALSRWVTSTVAPAPPNASAMAAPMPLLAPVTTARTPSSRRPPGCATWSDHLQLYDAADAGQADGGRHRTSCPRRRRAAAQLACVLEASAEKPGNITPSHDFGDTSYEDMLRSGIALGPELGRAGERGVGETVLAAVRASRDAAGANTNLGIALLLAPLARAALIGWPPP